MSAQARQDKSFKGAVVYPRHGGDHRRRHRQELSFSGGAVGTTPVNVALNSAATAATLTGTVAVADDAALQAFAGQPITVTAGQRHHGQLCHHRRLDEGARSRPR